MDHMNHGDMGGIPAAGGSVSDQTTASSDSAAMSHGESMDMAGMSMKMYFHFDSKATILFIGWSTTTAAQMFGSCLTMFIVAALYEGLKVLREWIQLKYGKDRTVKKSKDNTAYGATKKETEPDEPSADKKTKCRMLTRLHAIQTLLHGIQLTISYCLMLVFMTFNAWLCLSIIAGATTGYFLFGWLRESVIDNHDHCH